MARLVPFGDQAGPKHGSGLGHCASQRSPLPLAFVTYREEGLRGPPNLGGVPRRKAIRRPSGDQTKSLIKHTRVVQRASLLRPEPSGLITSRLRSANPPKNAIFPLDIRCRDASPPRLLLLPALTMFIPATPR